MKNKLLFSMTSVLVSGVLHATPTIYPKDLTLISAIQNSTNSNLIADDANPRKFWVMPPNTATSKVGGLHTFTANLGFCKEMAKIKTYAGSMIDALQEMNQKELASGKEVEEYKAKIALARQELAKYIVSNNLHNINEIDDRLIMIEQDLSKLTDRAGTCTQECEVVNAQIRDLRFERSKLTRQRSEMLRDKFQTVKEMERKKQSIAGYVLDLEDAEQRYVKLINRIEDLKTRYDNMYGSYGTMEGARASISYESNWDANIEKLSHENPGIDFEAIHTQNVVMTHSLIGVENLPGKNAILNFELAGYRGDGTLSFPSYPQSLSANLRLSLIGACPVIHPDLFDLKIPTGTDLMKYGMIASYEFPSTFEMDVTAKYNMLKIYEKIVKSGKKGGLFKSKKWNSVEERNFFRDEFKVEWNEQDKANALTEEQKADYEKELRDNIFGRLAAIGLPNTPDVGALILQDAGPSGAAVLATSLANNKSCKASKWCTGASIGINVLDKIFGSSSSSASYKNVQDAELIERWSRKQVVYKPWITSYR